MDEIQAAIKSPVWWFSAVFIALAINLISSYLRDGTDRALRYLRKKLDDQKQKVAESNEVFIRKLQSDESLRRFLFEAELRARLMAIELFAGSALALLILAGITFSATQAFPIWVKPVVTGIFMLGMHYWFDRFFFALSVEKLLLKVERERPKTNRKSRSGASS